MECLCLKAAVDARVLYFVHKYKSNCPGSHYDYIYIMC